MSDPGDEAFLTEPLNEAQSLLLYTILWPVITETNHGDATTWPVWQFVRGTLQERGFDADEAAFTLPTLDRARFPYGLLWRSNPGASTAIQPSETVGLTLAGLDRVDLPTANRLAQLVALYAEREAALPLDPTRVVQENVSFNHHAPDYLTEQHHRAGVTSMNIRSSAELLLHEYTPLVSETQLQWVYEVPIGSDRLARFRGIKDARGYLRAIVAQAGTVSRSQQSAAASPVPASSRRELISEGLRNAVRKQMSTTALRKIDKMWQDEGFFPGVQPEPVEDQGWGGADRLTRFQGYLNAVDWTNPSQVTRALRVFEVALHHLFDHPWAPDWDSTPAVERLGRLFNSNGYMFADDGKITGGLITVISGSLLSNLTDPAVVQSHLNRIAIAIDNQDPSLAIGSAKELVESTAKLVLRDRRAAFTNNDDLPALVSKAQAALGIHPSTAESGADGSGGVKRMLGGVVSVTAGMAELRNRYGTGHGPDSTPRGLGVRHARLAINGAKLWCEFMLDTLADPRAPWRSATAAPGVNPTPQMDPPKPAD